MQERLVYRISGGTILAGMLLALIVGILAPLVVVAEMSLMKPVILLGCAFMVYLYCYAGRVPALLFMVVQLTSASVFLGTTFMWMFLIAGSMPAIYIARGIFTRQPFFDQLTRAIIVCVLGLVGAIYVAYSSFGGNMIGKLMDALQAQIGLMPDEMFAPYVEAVNSALSLGGLSGEALTVASYREQISAMLSALGETYAQIVPGALLTGAALTGVLSTLWGNRVLARRGLCTEQSYVRIRDWYMPRQMTFGMTLLWIAGFMLYNSGYSGGATVYLTVYQLIGAAFAVQGLCSINRFFTRKGMSDGGRRAFVTILILLSLAFRLVALGAGILGAASSLFGSHGAFRAHAQNHDNDRPDED